MVWLQLIERRITMAKVIKTTSAGISRFLARFERFYAQRTYRWYEVEVASF
jgi:hypothetical protein